MRVRYFVIDSDGHVRKASQAAVHGIWEGTRPVSDLGFEIGDELRLISVVCDDNLRPVKFDLLRLETAGDHITRQSRHRALAAVDALRTHEGRKHRAHDPPPEVMYQLEGWPESCLQETAVALDIPVLQFEFFGIGGPLVIMFQLGMSIRDALRYYEELRNSGE